jgi:hypothetical protein
MPGRYFPEAIRTVGTWATTALAAAWKRSAASTKAYAPRSDRSCESASRTRPLVVPDRGRPASTSTLRRVPATCLDHSSKLRWTSYACRTRDNSRFLRQTRISGAATLMDYSFLFNPPINRHTQEAQGIPEGGESHCPLQRLEAGGPSTTDQGSRRQSWLLSVRV